VDIAQSNEAIAQPSTTNIMTKVTKNAPKQADSKAIAEVSTQLSKAEQIAILMAEMDASEKLEMAKLVKEETKGIAALKREIAEQEKADALQNLADSLNANLIYRGFGLADATPETAISLVKDMKSAFSDFLSRLPKVTGLGSTSVSNETPKEREVREYHQAIAKLESGLELKDCTVSEIWSYETYTKRENGYNKAIENGKTPSITQTEAHIVVNGLEKVS